MASDDEIHERVKALCRRKSWSPRAFSIRDGKMYFSSLDRDAWTAEELRALANVLDGAEDATRAMITDLQEESAAYRRGREKGKAEALAIARTVAGPKSRTVELLEADCNGR